MIEVIANDRMGRKGKQIIAVITVLANVSPR